MLLFSEAYTSTSPTYVLIYLRHEIGQLVTFH
jgi:hypothetical protein